MNEPSVDPTGMILAHQSIEVWTPEFATKRRHSIPKIVFQSRSDHTPFKQVTHDMGLAFSK
jgi:hypothetical protein